MFIGFIGTEAAQLHGLKYALERVYILEQVTSDEINDTLMYYRDHGMRPIFLVRTQLEVKEVYNALIRGLEREK